MTARVPSQAAREAAEAHIRLGLSLAARQAMLAGEIDDHRLVQAFAAFEAAARKDERERAAQFVEADPIAAAHDKKRIATAIRQDHP